MEKRKHHVTVGQPRMRSIAAAALLSILLWASGSTRLHAQTWNLQWSDEFNASSGTAPSSGTWTFDTGGGGWGNGELETYCAPYSSASPCIRTPPICMKTAAATWSFARSTTMAPGPPAA